jgi:predicted dehydrogenase
MVRVNCGVIGLGWLGFKHTQALTGRIESARPAAVLDPAEEARKNFADYQKLFNKKDVDAVAVASPSGARGRIIP